MSIEKQQFQGKMPVDNRWVYIFSNGYGLSIILKPGLSYGGDSGLFEIGIIDDEENLLEFDDNPWFDSWGDNVIGYLDFEDVAIWIRETEALEDRK